MNHSAALPAPLFDDAFESGGARGRRPAANCPRSRAWTGRRCTRG
ncbi:hypothetical protein ABMX48_35150 [Streptomyces cavourensis]